MALPYDVVDSPITKVLFVIDNLRTRVDGDPVLDGDESVHGSLVMFQPMAQFLVELPSS